MLNIMAKDPNFVSVRLPDDVAYWLRESATDNKLVRADKPNMGGSIIAIVRTVMQGQTISNNVGQFSAAPNVDIESMINDAIAPLLARLEAVETKLSTEATAPRKFHSSATSESEGSSAAKVEASSLEIESLPIIEESKTIETPMIEKSLPDKTLSKAPAETKKPKTKSKSKYTRENLTALTTLQMRKIYNQVLPFEQRDGTTNPKTNFATKDIMIEAILKA